jgi:hypothetical protein
VTVAAVPIVPVFNCAEVTAVPDVVVVTASVVLLRPLSVKLNAPVPPSEVFFTATVGNLVLVNLQVMVCPTPIAAPATVNTLPASEEATTAAV